MATYVRAFVSELSSRLREENPLIQAVLGPRQVGKTTGVRYVLTQGDFQSHYISADDLTPLDAKQWLEEHWGKAKRQGPGTVLVIDEIQKIDQWSDSIKRLWDTTPIHERPKLVILGSSSWQLHNGLRESLAGRFELIRVSHWDALEAAAAFNATFEEYLVYGGYPKVLEMRDHPERAMNYLHDSIYTPVIGKDLLQLKEIKKPALLRQLFELVILHPVQEISYRKLLGQLQDTGNTETAKHYIQLLEAAFLIRSLEKYSGNMLVRKSSSPKLIALAPCFYALFAGSSSIDNPIVRGRLFEQIVGQVLTSHFSDVYYWREDNKEIDFVVLCDNVVIGIEVKSGRLRSFSGRDAFRKKFNNARVCVISQENIMEWMQAPKAFLLKSAV